MTTQETNNSESAARGTLNKEGVATATVGALVRELGSNKQVSVITPDKLSQVISDIVVENLTQAGTDTAKIDREALGKRVQASLARHGIARKEINKSETSHETSMTTLEKFNSESTNREVIEKEGIVTATTGTVMKELGQNKRVSVFTQAKLSQLFADIVVEELSQAGTDITKVDREALGNRVEASLAGLATAHAEIKKYEPRKQYEPRSSNGKGKWSITAIGWVMVFVGGMFAFESGANVRAAPGSEKMGALMVSVGFIVIGFVLVAVARMRKR